MIYKLELTEEELSIINRALGDIPYKYAAPVILAINEQIEAQKKGPSTEATG